MRVRPARHWLAPQTGALKELLHEHRGRRHLDHALAECLPHQLRPHCHAAGISGEVLQVVTESATYAGLLHHLGPGLCAELSRRLGRRVVSLRVRVDPGLLEPQERQRPAPRRARVPEQGTARALAQAAEAVSDPALGAALQRLARRLGGG